MKKTILATLVAATSFGAFASTPAYEANSEFYSAESIELMSAIDSSGWAVNPEDHGMTAQEFVHQEARFFINNFVNNFKAGWNNVHNFRQLNQVGDTWVVTPALDHLYSVGGVDTSKPFSVTVPSNGDKFQSLHIQTSNHTIPVYEVEAGTYHFTPDMFDTRFVAIGIRLATDGTEEDMARLRVLQDQIEIVGGGDGEGFEAPDLDRMFKVRAALMEGYNNHLSVAQDKHIEWDISDVTNWEGLTYANAGAWGLSPHDTAMYPVYAKEGVKGGECYTATYRAPKSVDPRGYYSITVYGEDKFLMTNENNIVSTNQGLTTNEDGTFTVVFGGEQCGEYAEKTGVNYAATPADNWGFTLRVYLPDVADVQDWEANMPEIQPLKI